MSEHPFFKEALSSFAAGVAYVDSIRHLHDKGMSVSEIKKNLTFPVSEEKIEKAVKEYEQEKKSSGSEYTFVQDTDRYGRKTFRRVKKNPPG